MREPDQVILRMRSAIADLKCGTVQDAEYEASPVAPSPEKTAHIPPQSPEPKTAKAEAPATVFAATTAAVAEKAETEESGFTTEEALIGAQNLVAELHKAAQALVREVSVLEERLEGEAQAAHAARDYAAATKKVQSSAVLEQQANQLAQAASAHYSTSATERKNADELVVGARTETETVRTQLTKLEQWLDQCEARATECAAQETAARSEAAEAAARVAACQAAYAAAEKEAQTAKERAESLTGKLPQAAPSSVGISEVQTLAARIAQEASALTPGSEPSAEKGDPLSDTAQWHW